MPSSNNCPKCDGKMRVIHQERQIFRPDPETMTDGQLAEQHAAEMGGPFEEGIHGTTHRIYECTECGEQVGE